MVDDGTEAETNPDAPPAEDLTWQDYGAILLALAQTVLLPFLLAAAFLFLLFLVSVYLI